MYHKENKHVLTLNITLNTLNLQRVINQYSLLFINGYGYVIGGGILFDEVIDISK